MDYLKFTASYRNTGRFVLALEITVFILVIADGLLAAALFGHRDAVVLVPPHLNGEVRILADRSSQGYVKAWGLFLAGLLGNISPANVKFVQKSLEPMISPGVYREVTDILNVQAEEILADHISITFEPKSVTFDEESELVFVTGQTRVKGPTGPAKTFLRTYEFLIGMEDYRPSLKWMEMYEGNPRNGKTTGKKKDKAVNGRRKDGDE